MKYILHKLPEGFIIISDEPLKVLDYFYFNIDGLQDILQVESEFHLDRIKNHKENSKVIAQQEQIDFSVLSEEEQKEIGWFDIEKLFKQSLLNYKPESVYKSDILKDVINNGISRNLGFRDGFEKGFIKAQELLSDRMFTLEEARKIFDEGVATGVNDWSRTPAFNEFIQSLSQKSWKIELETETIKGKYLGKKQIGTTPAGEPIKINEGYEEIIQPKLTQGKVKILKLL